MTDHDSRGARGSNPPPLPKPRQRWKYDPDDFVEGLHYIMRPASWRQRRRPPSPDRTNRVSPWGYDTAPGGTSLLIAPYGISPRNGFPRLLPPTIGSLKNQHSAAAAQRDPSRSAASVSSALTKHLREVLLEQFAQLKFDPFKRLVGICNDPASSNRDVVSAIRTMLPYVLPRQKSIDITRTTETTHRYVVELPAATDITSEQWEDQVKVIDVSPTKKAAS
jgi:hypothetical protein